MRIGCAAALFLVTIEITSVAAAQSCGDGIGNGSIGVFADAAGTNPCTTVPAFVPTTLYVLATLGGQSSAGITGAEFRIEFSNMAGGPIVSWTANPAANLAVGDPIDLTPGEADPNSATDDRGVNVAFAGCQQGPKVLLGTIQIIALASPVPASDIVIKRREPPSSATFACPLFTMCDDPIFTKVCLTQTQDVLGREAVLSRTYINSSPCLPCVQPPITAALGIYRDALGTQTQLCADEGLPTVFHLVGLAQFTQPPGLTGAEFRIEVGNPSGYAFSYTPPPGASAFGTPFDLTPGNPSDPAGTTLLFNTCQPAPVPAPGQPIDFGTISVLNYGGGVTTPLRIRGKVPPASPGTPCPRVFLCDNSLFSAQCMSPLLDGQDLVFETTLNPQPCLPVPFVVETLQLDTHENANDGNAGPVATSQILDRRKDALITIEGTASLVTSSAWVSPPAVICGFPERAPATPTPGITNHWVGSDPEVDFAVARSAGSTCSPDPLGHHGRLQIDTGTGYQHLEPLGGLPSAPAPGHRYRYVVHGHDQPLRFRWAESATSDDYGIFSIRIEEANPVDAPQPEDPGQKQRLWVTNVPDPFNPVTRIDYEITTPAPVAISIYDVRGRMVWSWSHASQITGFHSVVWEGQNTAGAAVPSGVYFARVETPSARGVERLTLIR